jgi:hypothetical protein
MKHIQKLRVKITIGMYLQFSFQAVHLVIQGFQAFFTNPLQNGYRSIELHLNSCQTGRAQPWQPTVSIAVILFIRVFKSFCWHHPEP